MTNVVPSEPATGEATTSPWRRVARDKLARVLGPEKAEQTLRLALHGAGLADVSSPDELFRLSQAIERMGGFAATVGALLALHAVMNGAAGSR